MLEHHRDACGACSARVTGGKWRALKQHLPLIGAHKTIDGLDQGRLACTIFAKHGVDLALVDIKANIAIRDDARIGFGQSLQFKKLHIAPVFLCAASSARDSKAVATPKAMACGCLPKDISPIGQDMREICALL